MEDMSTKIKEYVAQIYAPVQTKCSVRTQNSIEDVREYVRNTFIESMEEKSIYIQDGKDIDLIIVEIE
tara:strand:- start:95 stop:298 length:204 start_codon:yes stop_codon:yes gene_type:complete